MSNEKGVVVRVVVFEGGEDVRFVCWLYAFLRDWKLLIRQWVSLIDERLDGISLQVTEMSLL